MNPKPTISKFSFVFLFLLIISACEKNEQLPVASRGEIISSFEAGSLNKNEVIARVDELDASTIAQYNVKYYSIDYRSIYMGEPVNTRGMLFLPEGVDSMVLINYTHGTLFPLNIDVVINNLPSNYRGESTQFIDARNFGLSLASNGFAVFMPDYIGFTNSTDKEHPYIYYPELFNAILDGIRAAKNFIASQGFNQDKRVFLSGWSQGAGASLASHKFIESMHSDEFTVVASSGLAGPYNCEKFLNFVFENKAETFEYLNIYSWAVYSMNKFSKLKRPTDQLFTYPVYDQMSAILVPSKIPEQVLNNYFMKRITDKTDVEMVALIKSNSFHENWLPLGKVIFHHGDADNIVPYFNSVDAKAGLSAAGAEVVFYSYPGGGHMDRVGIFITNTITEFNQLK